MDMQNLFNASPDPSSQGASGNTSGRGAQSNPPTPPDPFGNQNQQPPDDPTERLFSYGPQYDPLDPDLQTGLRYTHSVNQPAPNDLFDPMQVNYDPMRNALDMGEERMQEANLELNQQAQERFERAKFRTLWNIMGPETFNLISGAGVDTGTEEALRLQMQAEEDANRIDQQTTQQEAEQEIQNAQERARLLMKERQENEQLERQSRVQEYEAEQQRRQNIAGAASSAFSTQAQRDMARQQAEAERRQARLDRLNEANMAAQDLAWERQQFEVELMSDLRENPQLAAPLGRLRSDMYPDASQQQIKASVGRDLLASSLMNPDEWFNTRGVGSQGGDGGQGDYMVLQRSQGGLTHLSSTLALIGEDQHWIGDSRSDGYMDNGNLRDPVQDVANAVEYAKGQLSYQINALDRILDRNSGTVPREVLSNRQKAQEVLDTLDEMEITSLDDVDRVREYIEPIVAQSHLGTAPVQDIEGPGGRLQHVVISAANIIQGAQDPRIPYLAAYTNTPVEDLRAGITAMQRGGLEGLGQYAQEYNTQNNTGQDAQQGGQPNINQRTQNANDGRAMEPQQDAYEALDELGFEGDVETMTPAQYASLPESERTELKTRVENRDAVVVVDRGRGDPLRQDIAAYPDDLDRLYAEQQSRNAQDRFNENVQSVSNAVEAPFRYMGRNLDRNSALSVLHDVTGDPMFDSNPYSTGGRSGGGLSDLSSDDYKIEEGPAGPELVIHNPNEFGAPRRFALQDSSQAAQVERAMQTILNQ